ncbi:MAG: hypothetical protein E7238_02630 [Sarcina sp.]|nr:hypothetical protein [Sarcina sp.]
MGVVVGVVVGVVPGVVPAVDDAAALPAAGTGVTGLTVFAVEAESGRPRGVTLALGDVSKEGASVIVFFLRPHPAAETATEAARTTENVIRAIFSGILFTTRFLSRICAALQFYCKGCSSIKGLQYYIIWVSDIPVIISLVFIIVNALLAEWLQKNTIIKQAGAPGQPGMRGRDRSGRPRRAPGRAFCGRPCGSFLGMIE